jgi:hypothetical protein
LPTDGEVRAFTCTTYGRIWDAQIIEAVQRINQDDRWHVPLKASGGKNSKQATTLYASDRDLFVFYVIWNQIAIRAAAARSALRRGSTLEASLGFSG